MKKCSFLDHSRWCVADHAFIFGCAYLLWCELSSWPHILCCSGDKVGRFNGVIDCFIKTAREEGIGAFYKGFAPNFGRLGSWNVAMFLTLEQVKKLITSKDD